MSQDHFFREHIRRIRSSLDPANQVNTIADWIVKNTTINGKPFSFVDHEYQQYIVNLDNPVIYVQKSSQIGISQLISHWMLGYLMMNPGEGCIYILPTSGFATRFGATRIGPVIEGSPALKEAMDPNLDSASVRRFKSGATLYMSGASKDSHALSVPASLIIGDELDAMEAPEVLSVYASRLTHTLKPMERYFSTPSFKNFGVNAGVSTSKQHIQLQKCCHCGHEFEPDYFNDVILPGFKGSLHEINYFTRAVLDKHDLSKAFLACPKCRKKVDQDIKYRRFVVKNPDSQSNVTGIFLTPWCSPLYMPPSRIIETSTKYKNKRHFYNQCLGLTYSDEESGFTEQEINELFTQDVNYPEKPSHTVLGCDLGGTCSTVLGYPAPNGHLRVTHVDWMPLHSMKSEFPKKLTQHRVISSVADALPFTDLIRTMQEQSHSLFAALKSSAKGMALYDIRAIEDDETRATFGVRSISYKRDACLDFLMLMIRNKQISFAPSTWGHRDRIVTELTDMKRVEETDMKGDKKFVWRKSQAGRDHVHHALMFLILANFIKGISSPAPALTTLASKFKVTSNV
jgi:hypothetical protein